jgi:hypothetical protein
MKQLTFRKLLSLKRCGKIDVIFYSPLGFASIIWRNTGITESIELTDKKY